MRLLVAATGTNWLFPFIVNSTPVGDTAIFIMALDFFEWKWDILREELFAGEKLLKVWIVGERWMEWRLRDAG